MQVDFCFLLKKHSVYVKSWVVYIVLLIRAWLRAKTMILCRLRETGSKIVHKSPPGFHSRERNLAEKWCLLYIASAKAQTPYVVRVVQLYICEMKQKSVEWEALSTAGTVPHLPSLLASLAPDTFYISYDVKKNIKISPLQKYFLILKHGTFF